MSLTHTVRISLAVAVTVLFVAWQGWSMTREAASGTIRRTAEDAGSTWVRYFSDRLGGFHALLLRRQLTPRQAAILNDADTFADVFSFRLYDAAGALVVVSDGPLSATRAQGSAAFRSPTGSGREIDPVAVEVVGTGRASTTIADGAGTPALPPWYAETYMPITADGLVIGAAHLFVDVTAAREAILASFARFGLRLGLVVAAAMLVPMGGVALLSRRLRAAMREAAAARDEALQADRAKSRFLASMSHEIRTPLNGVIGMAEILGDTRLDANQRNACDIIDSSARSLLALINDILDFSRLEAGGMRIVDAPFVLSQIADGPAAILGKTARDKGIELLVRIDPALPRQAVGDVNRLRQVLMNFASNAVKFTTYGYVRIDLQRRGDCLRLEVRDTGPGISRDQAGQLFTAFSQIEDGARHHEGTGLGLAISKALVELMGGQIGLDSEPGEGSTFWAEVPLRPIQEDRSFGDAPGFAGSRVLVIDDNGQQRAILTEALTSWGLCCDVAGGIDGAVSVIRSSQARGATYDAFILDTTVDPDGTGIDRLRQTVGASKLPVLAIVPPDGPNDWPMPEGADALVKPVDRSHLYDCLVERLGAAADAEAAEKAAEAEMPPGNPLDQPRILVVEDNKVNVMVVGAMLKRAGHSYDVASDGQEAIWRHSELRPDIILMDVSMPILDGYKATRAIRSVEAQGGKRSYIVGLTANAFDSDREACLAAGMDEFMTKPISGERLREVLSHVSAARAA